MDGGAIGARDVIAIRMTFSGKGEGRKSIRTGYSKSRPPQGDFGGYVASCRARWLGVVSFGILRLLRSVKCTLFIPYFAPCEDLVA